MKQTNGKLKLYAFNNLTKTLSFNIYDICYAKTEREQKDYIAYIDEQYNSERLTKILCDVTDIIGANVLSISRQDYEPQGASVNLLIADEAMKPSSPTESLVTEPQSEEIMFHLDKSHVTVHTYPSITRTTIYLRSEWISASRPAAKYRR